MLAFLLTHPLLAHGQLLDGPRFPSPHHHHEFMQKKLPQLVSHKGMLVRRNMTFVPSFILYIYMYVSLFCCFLGVTPKVKA